MQQPSDMRSTIEALGGVEAVAAEYGCSPERVYQVIADNRAPAQWFLDLEGFAASRGVVLRRELFGRRKPDAAATFDIATAGPGIKAAAKT